MFAYVARQPIVDTSQQLYAYELLFRDGEKNSDLDIETDCSIHAGKEGGESEGGYEGL